MANKKKNMESYFTLKDAANLYASGLTKSDRRIQVKMPGYIVDELDKSFPEVDRSSVVTSAVIEVLIRKKLIDDPSLEHWIGEEQHDMDRMWEYLEERDAS